MKKKHGLKIGLIWRWLLEDEETKANRIQRNLKKISVSIKSVDLRLMF